MLATQEIERGYLEAGTPTNENSLHLFLEDSLLSPTAFLPSQSPTRLPRYISQAKPTEVVEARFLADCLDPRPPTTTPTTLGYPTAACSTSTPTPADDTSVVPDLSGPPSIATLFRHPPPVPRSMQRRFVHPAAADYFESSRPPSPPPPPPPTSSTGDALFERINTNLLPHLQDSPEQDPDLPRADPESCEEPATTTDIPAEPSHLASPIATIESRDVPSEWKTAITILLHKKGPTDDTSNFWHLALMSCIYKLLLSVLTKRLSSWAIDNELLSPEQKSARPSEGCYEHTYLLSSVVADTRRQTKKLNLAWLDLRNAFGSIPHSVIHTTLTHMGAPPNLVEFVSNAYTGATTTIRTSTGDTNAVPIHAGVKQGCPLSPFLFNLCIELIIRSVKTAGEACRGGAPKHFQSPLSVLAYADDLVFITRKKENMDNLLNATSANILGLSFRPDKCTTLTLHDGS